jgi:hypothetical protein
MIVAIMITVGSASPASQLRLHLIQDRRGELMRRRHAAHIPCSYFAISRRSVHNIQSLTRTRKVDSPFADNIVNRLADPICMIVQPQMPQ